MSEDAAEMCGRPELVGRAGIIAEPSPGVKLDLSTLGTERRRAREKAARAASQSAAAAARRSAGTRGAM